MSHAIAARPRSKTRIYRIWSSIKNRCESSNVVGPTRLTYQDRNISMCPEWSNSLDSFRDWALENGYGDSLIIDRIDNDSGYCPDNCRWVDYQESADNRRSTIRLEIDGVFRTLSEWAKISSAKRHTIYTRIFVYGWTLKSAVFGNRVKSMVLRVERKPDGQYFSEG